MVSPLLASAQTVTLVTPVTTTSTAASNSQNAALIILLKALVQKLQQELALLVSQRSLLVQPMTAASPPVSISQNVSTVSTTTATVRPFPEYWFGPLPALTMRGVVGSTDFMSLFTADAPWTNAASHIQVFQLFGEWLLNGNATDAQLQQVVTNLKSRGMGLAIEAGPLYPTATCGNGIEGFSGAQWSTFMSRIKAAGGTIDYVTMDEPYYFAHVYSGVQACHWSDETIAQDIQTFIASVHAQFPNAVIGEVEPTTVGNASAFQEWLNAFEQVNKYSLPFLHLDVDWSNPNWPALAKSIETTTQQNGVPFGIIYNGGGATSDEGWIDAALGNIQAYRSAGGNPDEVIFESWTDKPDYVLPETTSYTFTNLIDSYFGSTPVISDESPIPAGLFKVGASIYSSNGSHYCLYNNWANFVAWTGVSDVSTLPSYESIPSMMVSDGICQAPTTANTTPIPAGAFKVGAAIFYSNGSQYCAFDNWSDFLAIFGITDTSQLPSYSYIPSSMVNDGTCANSLP